jgi:hypothetical protein
MNRWVEFMMGRVIAVALMSLVTASLAIPSPVFAGQKIALCHAGVIKLLSFAEHVKTLRGMTRYDPEEVDKLVEQERKGGPDFFSSQVIVQEENSGSGTFDLRTFHGINDAADYRNVRHWTCEPENFPIVYFIGFRVREIANNTILVSRETGVVNVISLGSLDKHLEKHLKVKIYQSDKILCNDIGAGCIAEIFYERG